MPTRQPPKAKVAPDHGALGGPAGKRPRKRAMPTLAEFAERYLKEEAETKLKSGTVVNYRIYPPPC